MSRPIPTKLGPERIAYPRDFSRPNVFPEILRKPQVDRPGLYSLSIREILEQTESPNVYIVLGGRKLISKIRPDRRIGVFDADNPAHELTEGQSYMDIRLIIHKGETDSESLLVGVSGGNMNALKVKANRRGVDKLAASESFNDIEADENVGFIGFMGRSEIQGSLGEFRTDTVLFGINT